VLEERAGLAVDLPGLEVLDRREIGDSQIVTARYQLLPAGDS
jgi:hypothetical protein